MASYGRLECRLVYLRQCCTSRDRSLIRRPSSISPRYCPITPGTASPNTGLSATRAGRVCACTRRSLRCARVLIMFSIMSRMAANLRSLSNPFRCIVAGYSSIDPILFDIALGLCSAFRHGWATSHPSATCEYVVVGSGAGGGTVAARLRRLVTQFSFWRPEVIRAS